MRTLFQSILVGAYSYSLIHNSTIAFIVIVAILFFLNREKISYEKIKVVLVGKEKPKKIEEKKTIRSKTTPFANFGVSFPWIMLGGLLVFFDNFEKDAYLSFGGLLVALFFSLIFSHILQTEKNKGKETVVENTQPISAPQIITEIIGFGIFIIAAIMILFQFLYYYYPILLVSNFFMLAIGWLISPSLYGAGIKNFRLTTGARFLMVLILILIMAGVDWWLISVLVKV